MSRPTVAEARELESLECAAGKISAAQEAAGILAIRMRQVQRRAPALHELMVAGQAQVTALADALDEAHALLGEVLADKRRQRQDSHFGGE